MDQKSSKTISKPLIIVKHYSSRNVQRDDKQLFGTFNYNLLRKKGSLGSRYFDAR